MQIPHNAHVLVADGRKLLFFRNEGDGQYPNLQVEREEHHDDREAREHGTDRPGRAFAAAGRPPSEGGPMMGAANRSAYSETDFKQLEEDRFAHEAADLLKKKALNHEIEHLIVVAPPKTLGEMRKHYHKEVEQRIAGEIPKDLTNMPVPDIERVIQES
ncbi:host attachment family protein [Sphingosinicella sp. YJ22]|uniref:host attachment family protein n=1 Tax=Sphingosinicella sp. YJ22 TaxID=1104780 RepID=UPI0014090CBD|nr:host attachment family protein [Sphingosinicella sp. YJ22]